MGLGAMFLYPTPDDWALGPFVQGFLLAGQSEACIQGSGPHKKDSCHPLRHHCRFTQFLNLTVPSNISLLKMDSGLAVIASQLIIELKALVVVIAVHGLFLSL